MKTIHDPRHEKRQHTVQLLFAQSFAKQPVSDQKTKGVIDHLEKIDNIIAAAAPEFPIDKINKVDLAILRLAVYELIIDKSEPPKVVLDEAIELAKEFGSNTSPAFVNGALGKVMKETEKNG